MRTDRLLAAVAALATPAVPAVSRRARCVAVKSGVRAGRTRTGYTDGGIDPVDDWEYRF